MVIYKCQCAITHPFFEYPITLNTLAEYPKVVTGKIINGHDVYLESGLLLFALPFTSRYILKYWYKIRIIRQSKTIKKWKQNMD